MTQTNIDSWKQKMKVFATDNNLDIQEVYQRFILEEFALLISHSEYREKLIIKGGFVVSTLLGFETRMTRDIDLTYNSVIYSQTEISKIISEVIEVRYPKVFNYSISNIEKAQSNGPYSGFTITLVARLATMKFFLKLDISNNSLIHPKAIQNNLKSFFHGIPINVYTYQIENIIAEKFETTLDRGEFNGRMRDLFDIYFLVTECAHLIDEKILINSIEQVCENRGTVGCLYDYDNIKNELLESKIFNKNFKRYRNSQYPGSLVSIEDIFTVFDAIHNKILLI